MGDDHLPGDIEAGALGGHVNLFPNSCFQYFGHLLFTYSFVENIVSWLVSGGGGVI